MVLKELLGSRPSGYKTIRAKLFGGRNARVISLTFAFAKDFGGHPPSKGYGVTSRPPLQNCGFYAAADLRSQK
jgi:hypothetical protein